MNNKSTSSQINKTNSQAKTVLDAVSKRIFLRNTERYEIEICLKTATAVIFDFVPQK